MTSCLFCQIVSGEKAALPVFEDELTFAFLDHRPLFPGHTLLVPKAHHQTLPDLPPELLAPFLRSAQLLARAVEKGMGVGGTFLAINNKVSQSVPHLHFHIVPRKPKDGLKGFFWPRVPYSSPEHAVETQAAIRAALGDLAS
ncbi:MAG TPA: HIT family protein [Candidatus Polarisedimenticolaceae bacterium]|nr:HIT family protein [Candidatus Polarisedimenticolaceae bacterium]